MFEIKTILIFVLVLTCLPLQRFGQPALPPQQRHYDMFSGQPLVVIQFRSQRMLTLRLLVRCSLIVLLGRPWR